MKPQVVASLLALAATVAWAPSVAHARDPYTSPLALDLEHGHWFEAGLFGGKASDLEYAALRLDGRVALLPFAALRASTSVLADRFDFPYGPGGDDDDTWLGRSWLGAELFTAWHSHDDTLQLRLGGSFELGAAPMGAAVTPRIRASHEEPGGQDGAWRARAGVSLGGNRGHLQLEAVDVRAFTAERYAATPTEIRLLRLGGAVALDDQRTVYLDASFDDDERGALEVGLWQMFGRDRATLGPRTSVGFFVARGFEPDASPFELGLAVLHQR